MKELKKYLYKDNGTISALVLITLLFFIIVLSTMYFVNASNRTIQLKNQKIVKDVYESELKQEEDIYIKYKDKLTSKE